jgi:hypothetical protein
VITLPLPVQLSLAFSSSCQVRILIRTTGSYPTDKAPNEGLKIWTGCWQLIESALKDLWVTIRLGLVWMTWLTTTSPFALTLVSVVLREPLIRTDGLLVFLGAGVAPEACAAGPTAACRTQCSGPGSGAPRRPPEPPRTIPPAGLWRRSELETHALSSSSFLGKEMGLAAMAGTMANARPRSTN